MSMYRLNFPLDEIDPIMMPGVDPEKPCIYIFFIEKNGCYVGKSGGENPVKRWKKDYSRNVQKMIEGKPWHGNPDRDYRKIHYALLQSVQERLKATLIIFENPEKSELNAREAQLIKAIGTLNGTGVVSAGSQSVGNEGIEAVAKSVAKSVNLIGSVGNAIDAIEKISSVVEVVENVTELVENVVHTGSNIGDENNLGMASRGNNSHKGIWLEYQVEAVHEEKNPYVQGTKRFERHEFLRSRKTRLTIGEYNRISGQMGLNRFTKKFIRSGIIKGCIRVFDESGTLTANVP